MPGAKELFWGSFACLKLWPVGHPWSWLLRASLPTSLTTPSPPPAKIKSNVKQSAWGLNLNCPKV